MIELKGILWSGRLKLGLTLRNEDLSLLIVFYSDGCVTICDDKQKYEINHLYELSEEEYFVLSLTVDNLPIHLDKIKNLQVQAFKYFNDKQYKVTNRFKSYLRIKIEI